MAHRHEYGKDLLEVFVGLVNSDQTEGRGGMRDHSVWQTMEAAFEAIKGEGVMGYGNGDVQRRTYSVCGADNCKAILIFKEDIYKGYGDKWLATRYNPLLKDPDYKTYLRLKEKFEK